MNAEFMNAISELEKEKGIDKEILLEAIEQALVAAYKRHFGANHSVRVAVDRETGESQIFAQRSVVETMSDPGTEIELTEARQTRPTYEIGDVFESCVTPKTFGRIAAQTAKQVVVQRIREAERGAIFNQYADKSNEMMQAVVKYVEKGYVYVEMGRIEGILPPSEQIPGERYSVNDRIRVYVLEVKKTSRGPQIVVSRSHPGLVKRLFETEVPEIQNGLVLVKSIAREAGQRTKIAMHSRDEEVDPIGACVGQRSSRIERVVEELRGEKIDIIKWSADPVEYISNALRPAQAVMVNISEGEKIARVVVPDNQLSLAIGKEGQNARLAAKLTGWKIDIKNRGQIMQQELFGEEAEEQD